MKNTLFLLCQDVVIDKETNQWNLMRHIENIKINLPKEKVEDKKRIALDGQFNLITFWRDASEGEELIIKYRLVNEDEDVLMESPEYKSKVKNDDPLYKHRVKMERIVVEKSGDYYFQLLKKEEGEYELKEEYKLNVEVNLHS